MDLCHNSMMRPNVVEGGGTSIWRITATILNKQSDKVVTTSRHKNIPCFEPLTKASTEPVVHTSVKANSINIDFGVTGKHSSYILHL
jgi:hypothetical protein